MLTHQPHLRKLSFDARIQIPDAMYLPEIVSGALKLPASYFQFIAMHIDRHWLKEAEHILSPNSDERIDAEDISLIVIHCISLPPGEFGTACIDDLFCNRLDPGAHPYFRDIYQLKVSSHLLIKRTGQIVQYVPFDKRAWHAGVSYWHGETDLNSHSIGIEIHNAGHADGYPEFPRRQIEAVIALTRDICARHAIVPAAVLGHSDIAISRKIDPGEKFPWATLAHHGVGHWVRPSRIAQDDTGCAIGDAGPHIDEARALLRIYGYDLQAHGPFDEQMRRVVEAFQRHFRPQRYDGKLDRSTLFTLRRLVTALGAAGGQPHRS